MTQIILATSSPYRKKFFENLEIDFICESSNIDEYHEGRPVDPSELTKYLARLKAETVSKNHCKGIVIGFDSLGYFNNEIIEKPKSKEEAYNRLKNLSGNLYEFYTGIHMINLETGKSITDFSYTKVYIRDLKIHEIEKYLEQDSKYNTYATGFDPQNHYSSTFAEKIEGSYNNFLMGLPLEKVIVMLKKLGYEIEDKKYDYEDKKNDIIHEELTLKELQELIMEQAKEKGFGTDIEDINVAEKIALIHSEISEAYEAYRHKNIDGKDGFNEELGDAIQRILHLSGIFNIDIEKEILKKLEYNKDRKWDFNNMNEKHG